MINTTKKYVPFLILFPIGLLLCIAAKYISGFADVYFDIFYAPVAGFFGDIAGRCPFSLSESICCIGIAGSIFLVIYTVYRIVKKHEKKSICILDFSLFVLSVASTIFFLFSMFCGVNYYRESFTSKSGLEMKESSKEELYYVCCSLVERANYLSQNLEHDDNNCTIIPDDANAYTLKAKRLYSGLYDEYSFLHISDSPYFGRPKPVFFSKVLSSMLISGMYTPYTLEANFCTEGPEFLLGSTMMHEISHVHGFMNESEANFISYLACVNSGDDYFEYSGICLALIYCGNALYKADYDLWRDFRLRYNIYLDADMNANNSYIENNKGKISDVSSNVNDTYLKLNNVSDGVESYGKMVDLILAYYRES